MNEFDIQKIKDTAFELYDFDADQLKLIEYFGDNFNDIMDILKTKLSDN
ncbi:hypothetical protein FACS189459_1250 [Bacilli bacterium]|nr:hypothetical protein FACS189459_1250 [Bacilli bacterium]